MTAAADLLVDAFGRVRGVVHDVVEGLTPEVLAFRPDPGANSIAWLVWHLTRVQDDHVADVAGTEQVWTSGGWAERFGLPFDPTATGYGQSTDEVAALGAATAENLIAYYDAVHEQTVAFMKGIADPDLERIVDTRWDPPVTLGVRLVSVVDDDLEHAGQAAYVKGLADRA
jgi:hypothetical protein